MADRVPEAWGPGETALGRGRARACESLGTERGRPIRGSIIHRGAAIAALVRNRRSTQR
jgi:hypothetical protein